MSLEKIKSDILKKYGYQMKPVSSIMDKPKKIIHISPLFDANLSGGIPEGSVVLISGPQKAGKTTAALHIAKGASDLDGRPVFYFDVEGRYKEMNLNTVQGFDPDSMEWIHSTEEKILTGDDHLNIAWDVIQNVPNAVIIIDSTSQLCSSDELWGEIKQGIRPSGPMLLSAFTRKLSAVISVKNTIVVMIQHIIADTGMSRKTKAVSGGNKIQYQADVNLECSHYQDWMDGENLIGKVSHWKVVTSALGGPSPSFPAYIRYGVGLDKIKEVVELSEDMGLVSKAGAWYTLNGLTDSVGVDEKITEYATEQGIDIENIMENKQEKEKLNKLFKFQGIAKTRAFLEENPYMLEVLTKQMQEFMV